jgi:hypothetical protein
VANNLAYLVLGCARLGHGNYCAIFSERFGIPAKVPIECAPNQAGRGSTCRKP